MASGGARARSGPPPDPDALARERDKGEWRTLPERREGVPPTWPLPTSSKRERELWEMLWADGRAVEWERQHLELTVANYVRVQHDAEKRSSFANMRTLAKQLAEDLGLTQGGMLRNRWQYATAVQSAPKRRRRSSKNRLTVVDNVDG